MRYHFNMKCKCGNEIAIGMAARVNCKGCKVLAPMTAIITVECNKCGARAQVPISGKDYIMGKTEP